MNLMAWPSLPGVRNWLQHARQAWRVLTSGGDHAEAWLERSIEAAQKARTEDEFKAVLETLTCDHLPYMTAEEKMALELVARMPDSLQRDLSVIREKRRQEGMPALVGRQLLAWGLRRFCPDTGHDKHTCRQAMTALRDAIKPSPPRRNSFSRLVQAIEGNLALESSEDMSQAEVLDALETLLDLVPDFREQMTLHREIPQHARDLDMLINRLKRIVDQDEERKQRQEQEAAFAKQLGTTKGFVAKNQDNGNVDKSASSSTAKDSKAKELLSHKDRQISALAGQLKQAGVRPDFASARARSQSKDGGKAGGKGKSRASSADSAKGGGKGKKSTGCWTCGGDHRQADCPQYQQQQQQQTPKSPASS